MKGKVHFHKESYTFITMSIQPKSIFISFQRERDEIKRRRYLSKTDLSAFHGAKPSIHYPPKRNMEFRTDILLIPDCSYISVRIDTSHITTRSPAQPYDWPRLG